MTHALTLLAQGSSSGGAGGGAGAIATLVYIAILVLVIVGFWKVFTKAGQPGWMSIIPILNLYILFKIAGRPWWWLLGLLVPLLNIIVIAMVSIDVAKSFGKGVGFGIGLWLLGFIFYPILGFGDAQYQGPAAAK